MESTWICRLCLEEHYEDGGEKLHEPHTEANSLTVLSATAILLNAIVVVAAGPTTSVQGEYLMTLYVPIAEAHDVDDTLRSARMAFAMSRRSSISAASLLQPTD